MGDCSFDHVMLQQRLTGRRAYPEISLPIDYSADNMPQYSQYNGVVVPTPKVSSPVVVNQRPVGHGAVLVAQPVKPQEEDLPAEETGQVLLVCVHRNFRMGMVPGIHRTVCRSFLGIPVFGK